MRLLFLLFSFLLINVSCVQEDSIVCPAVVCATDHKQIKLEILDQSGFNLISSKQIIASAGLKVYSNRLKKYLETEVDVSQKYILFSTYGSDEFNIEYNSTKPDVLLVETKFTPQVCCGTLDITKLTLNNKTILFNNADPTIITLKK